MAEDILNVVAVIVILLLIALSVLFTKKNLADYNECFVRTNNKELCHNTYIKGNGPDMIVVPVIGR